MNKENFFNPDDITKIEQEIYSDTGIDKPYFCEEIGQYLYDKWLLDNNDTTIITYTLPLIYTTIINNISVIRTNYMDIEDIFQHLVLILLQHLPKYKPDSGKIYVYLRMILTYRLYSYFDKHRTDKAKHFFSLEDFDAHETVNYDMMAFIIYLEKLQSISGPSISRIIQALIKVCNPGHPNIINNRKKLISLLSKYTGINILLVENALNVITEKYLHDIME